MDKTQKLIVALLVIAIVFSLTSIFFSISLPKADLGYGAQGASINSAVGGGDGDGSVSLIIEGPNNSEGAANG